MFYASRLWHQARSTPDTFYTKHFFWRETPLTPNTFHTRHRLHQTPYAYDSTQPLISDTLYTRPGTPGAFDTGNFVHQAPFARNILHTRHCLHPTQFATRSLLDHAMTHHLATPDTCCTKHLVHQTDVTPLTPHTCHTHPKMQRHPRTTSTSDRPRRARTVPHTSHKRPRLRRKRARTRPSVHATRPTQNGARQVSMLTATEIAPANATPHTSPAESPGTHNEKQRTPASEHGCGRPAELQREACKCYACLAKGAPANVLGAPRIPSRLEGSKGRGPWMRDKRNRFGG